MRVLNGKVWDGRKVDLASKEECAWLGSKLSLRLSLANSKIKGSALKGSALKGPAFLLPFTFCAYLYLCRVYELPGLQFRGCLSSCIGSTNLYAGLQIRGDSRILPHAADGALCVLFWQEMWIFSSALEGVSISLKLQMYVRWDTGALMNFCFGLFATLPSCMVQCPCLFPFACCPAPPHDTMAGVMPVGRATSSPRWAAKQKSNWAYSLHRRL